MSNPAGSQPCPCPPSFAQQRLWLLDFFTPDLPIHNDACGVHLRGELDRGALSAALNEIVRRHQVLRTRFPSVDGKPVGVTTAAGAVPLPWVELGRLREPHRRTEADRLARVVARQPFDLTRGPLLRARLARLDPRWHVLVLSWHRIAMDRASRDLLLRELAILYRGSSLPELPMQYADFAGWQRQRLVGEVVRNQLDYWRPRLAGLPVLALPTDRPRPPVQSFRGRTHAFALPAHAREGSWDVALLSIFQALLWRTTGQQEFAVGMPVAGRRAETEGLVGPFANILVLRGDLRADPRFHQLLERTADVVHEARAHQELPFELLVDALAPERDLSQNPLVQVIFSCRAGAALVEPELAPGLRVEVDEVATDVALFDLTLTVEANGESTLEYTACLFDATTVRRMADHFHTLLAGALRSPERRLSELPWLRRAEEHQVVTEWSGAGGSGPRATVHELFETRAAATPDAVAVVFADRRLSYRELNRRANRLAHSLRAHGVAPEVGVALCVKRSLDMVVAILGILKAGGAYVPLDPEDPPARLAGLLEDVGAAVLLGRLPEGLPAEITVLNLDEPFLADYSSENPGSGATAENLAYVMFTSGSTGRPKGVGVVHRGVVRLVEDSSYARLDAQETVLQFAPISFDASTLEIWGPLLNGGRLVIFPPHPPSLEELGSELHRHRVTTLWLTAGLFHQMIDEHPEGLTGLRQLLAGGDVLSARHLRRALAELPGCTVINGYGPTESTTFTCCYPLRAAGEVEEPVPIGRPISGTHIQVLDPSLRPVAAGIPGELAIGGSGLARGYFRRPGLSAASFVPDPRGSGGRLYRTGDVVRYLCDGRLQFLGRRDHQVKLRGFRIELGEVEAALSRHGAVREAVVVSRQDRLVAYIVGEGEGGSGPELCGWLRDRLPGTMIPSAVVFLDALPLTAQGKIDRAALPDPEVELGPEAAPRSPVEEILLGMWCEVLGRERLGIHDDFFELGGHSLLATQIASRVNAALGIRIGPVQLFERPTIAALATEIEGLATGTAPEPLRPVDRRGPLPLAFAQERLWFLQQLTPRGTAYNLAFPLELRGALDPEALRLTFEEIVRRHEVLRTTFSTVDERPVQVISPPAARPLPWVDLSRLPEPDRGRRVRQLMRHEEGRPFDLVRGPLTRTLLVRLAPDEHVFLLCCHHLVFDGWSVGVVVRELAPLYRGLVAGSAPALQALPALAIQYADFASHQRRWLAGGVRDRQLDWWRERLEPPPTARLATDRPRPPQGAAPAVSRPFRLPAALSGALRILSRQQGASLYMTLAAALQTLLHRHTGGETIILGTPIANRNRRELEELIGFFVNTQVLRADFADDPTFRTLLGRVREWTLGAWAHQDLPFEQLVEALHPDREASTQPVFQVLFAFQNAPAPPLTLPGLTVRRLPLEKEGKRTAMVDLSLGMWESGEILEGVLEYDGVLFEAATIDLLLEDYRRVLEELVADPDRRVSAILPECGHERRRIGSAVAPARPGDRLTAAVATAEQLQAKASGRRRRLSTSRQEVLARLLRGKKQTPAAETIPRRPAGEPPPPSFAQEQLWFLDQLTPDRATYNMPFPLRLPGPLDPSALAAGFDAVRRRHEVLGMSFPAVDGRPQVAIAAPTASPLPVADLADLPAAGRDRELRRLVAEDRGRPFDLARGPLLRTTLLRLGNEEHVLLLNVHHIVFDGWSLEILIRELSTFYGAGADAIPEALPIQYADFAHWQRGWLRGEVLERQLGYWRRSLATAPRVLALPTDRPRPHRPSSRGRELPVALSPERSAALEALGRRREATLFMTVLAAFQVMLGRYAGEDEIVVGTPVAGRNREQLDGLIGFFINVLPLGTDLGGDPSFDQLLARVRQVAVDAFAHQDLPFERLVAELRPQRDASSHPIFQVMFALQNLPRGTADTPQLTIRPVPSTTVTAKFDLTLILEQSQAGIRGMIEYATDLFDETTVRRWRAHFEHLLAAAVEDPGRRISRLPWLAPAERHQLLREWNVPGVDHPACCVNELFALQVARRPEATALVFENERWSYRELDRRAHQLARYLGTLGVGPEVRVGLCVAPSAEMVVGIVGILMAGGAYVPFDPSHPSERLAWMLADAGVAVVLTQEQIAGRLPALAAPVVRLDRDWPRIAERSSGDPAAGVRPENLAYVIYTSGSTGQPKGVGVEHRNVTRLFAATHAWFGFGPRDVWTLFHSHAFDFSVWELWGALIYGGRIVVVPREVARDAEAFCALVYRQGITVLNQTPSAFDFFMRVDAEMAGTTPLRLVIFGGEALAPRRLESFRQRYGAAGPRLINMYGITETTVHVTRHLVSDADLEAEASPIGRAIPEWQIRVLDDSLAPVPVGVVGQIYVGGAGVARGYLGRAGLSAERFLPDPYSGDPSSSPSGSRLYRSGDLARTLPNGNLEYLGRADFQVQIRGFRVELGEIEAVLSKHPQVRQAVVVTHAREPGRLVGYVVQDPGAPRVEEAELRRHLSGKLPDYMVPATLVVLDELPLNANGKVDRAALRRRVLPAPRRRAAPRTPGEELMVGIWREVLGVGQVGIDDHFFELGGHSLLATQIISRVRTVFGIEVPLDKLFDAPTPAGLGAAVDRLRAAGRGVADPPVSAGRRASPIPLSFAQERLWFLAQLDPESAVYNIPVAARLSDDVARLEAALNAVVDRHEVLRTVFPAVDGRPRQVIAPRLALPLPVVDLQRLPVAARESEARRLTTAEALAPFDLAAGPLIRSTLLRLADPGDHLLLLTMHHIVSDGWSMGIFVREATAFLKRTPLPSLPVQYADFACWQRRRPAAAVDLEYWKRQLADLPSGPDLPTDRPRPPWQSLRGATRGLAWSAELSTALAALGRSQSTTLFMTLLAAFQVLIGRYTGRRDVVVGSPVAGRNRREIEGLIGFFVNMLVLRADLGADPSFRELLATVRRTALDAYAHQDLPFERLVEALQPERHLNTTALFRVMLVLQNTPQAEGLRLPTTAVETGTAKFELSLSLQEGDAGIEGVLEYNTDLFDAVTVDRLAGHFECLLAAAVEDPERRISRLPWLKPHQRRQLLAEWNDTRVDRPALAIPELFAAQVERRPEATALVFERERWSYRALDQRTEGLARHLRALGVGPEVRVGVCAHRSTELVVALLGILKAGGAYVPIDPELPEARRRFLIEAAGVRLVLTPESLRAALPEAPEPGLPVAPDNLAYVLFTSGSTGEPKGSMISHRAIVNRLLWMQEAYGLTPGEGVLQKTPFSFDVSVWEFFWPLIVGARLVVAAPGVHRDPAGLARLVIAENVTTLHFVPSMLQAFLAEPDLRSLPLKRVITSGEALPLALAQRCSAVLGREVHNLYGPTEAAVDVSSWRYRPDDGHSVPIGRPIAGIRIHLLDRHLEPVPPPVAGELHIAGVGLARGYVDRPAQSAERFIPDPFSELPGDRLYRTGDLARWRTDGAVDFLGRIDHQIKIRGFRVELGEIEAVLCQVPGVRAAAVLARGDGASRRLVAYVVADGGDETLLREQVAAELPEYMVPWAFDLLEALPLTPNGKVDRAALARRPLPERGSRTPQPAPDSHVEQVLVEIWARVLGVDRVGRDDDFFSLGGHSLLATQVVSRVREAFGVELPVHAVFENPTVAGLAAAITAADRDQRMPPPPLVPQPPGARPVLSFAQERLWFLEQLEPGTAAYNLFMPQRLPGDLDPAALASALGKVIERHRTLGSRFVTEHGRPVLVLDPPAAPALPVVELKALADADGEAEIRRWLAWESRRPFDLARGPLLRALLLRRPDQYVFLLTIHHIVTDGWSMDLLAGELAAIYAGGELPALPIQYPDFAAWQRRWLRGEALASHLAWWRQHLGGELPVLSLPTDRPRPRVQTYRGEALTLRLPAPLSAELRQLGRERGATLFMTLLAAFQVLLGRWTGQQDLLIGTPIAGRTQRQTEPLVGFFVNTLVLRGDLTGEPTFEQLLARVRQTALRAYSHQDVPFEKLVAELRPDRDLSRTPLFQVFFNLLNFRPAAAAGAPEPPALDAGVPSKFDLTLYAAEQEQGLRLDLVYNADLFSRPRMAAMGDALRGLLEQIAADPGRRIGEYSLCRGAAAAGLPDPGRPLVVAGAWTPAERFAARARQEPGRQALADEAGVWTYEEVDEHTNRLAHYLLRRDLGRGRVVAIHGRRGAALAAAVVGVAKAGAAFLILDPAHPPARNLACLEASGARGWLEPEGGSDLAPELAAAVARQCPDCRLRLDRRGRSPDLMGPDSPPELPIAVDDLAYVTFTSGTGGGPRGITGTHRPVAAFLDWYRDRFALTPDDRFAMLSGLSHDPLQRDLWTPLVLGAQLSVPSPEVLAEPRELVAWLRQEKITVLHLTPSLGDLLCRATRPGVELPAVRLVLFGGEPLNRRIVSRCARLMPEATCVNVYGTTETPQVAAFFVISDPYRDDDGDEEGVVPLGWGRDGVDLVLRNDAGERCGIGELGEICVRGPYLARGYLDDEQLTRDRFLGGGPGDCNRLYRTGDLGRYRPDGAVEFFGRADGQLNIRGHRVEPGEIEAALRAHPGVAAAAVTAPPGGRGGADGSSPLIAWVVPEASVDPAPGAGDLRSFLRARLPDAMVPTHFPILQTLPLTPHGKVDRAALARLGLPSSESERALARAAHAPPQTWEEEILAGVQARLLGLETVGRDDDFFALGGHSLLAIRMISRLRDALGVELPVRAVFEHPTVAELASEIRRRSGIGPQAPPLRPVPRTGAMPLSFAQQRLFFLDRLEGGHPFYNLAHAVRLDGRLDLGALAAAVRAVLARHESLRTSFHEIDGEPAQVIATHLPVTLRQVDLTALPASRREKPVRQLAAAEAMRPFALTRAPLVRFTLLRLAPAEHVLLCTIHHIISDAWSTEILVRELTAIYRTRRLPAPLPIQYADYAVWQRQWLTGPVLERQLAYWRRQLAAVPTLELPVDRPRPATQTYRGALMVLPAGLPDGLRDLGRGQGATLFMTLVAAFQLLLARHTGSGDVVLGTPIANRTRGEVEPLVGFFVNTLVLRTAVAGAGDFVELLARVRETALGAYGHQDLPFERLVEELRPRRDLSRHPLFQVMFQLFDAPPAGEGAFGDRPVETARRISLFDLTLKMVADRDGLTAAWEYNVDLFDATTVRRIGERFRILLAAIATDPRRRLEDLPLLSAAELGQLVREWNDTATARERAQTVHTLFEAQAVRTPEAVAVRCEHRALTYAELNAAANRLASHLRRRGVGSPARRSEVLVGLALDRSANLVVALLAVLKAGAAYVPMDPSFPRERLRFMVEDAVRIVVTEKRLVAELPAAPEVICLDDPALDGAAGDAPVSAVGAENTVYAIYTSGSTGTPKGVRIAHGALVNFLLSMCRRPGLGAGDVLLALTSPSFDIAGLELLLPLLVGARMELVGAETARDGRLLLARMESSRATVLQATPATWRLLLAAGWRRTPGLRVLCGGEAAAPELVAALVSGGGEAWNLYGPTETTIWSTVERLRAEPRIAIGRPIANTAVYLLDRAARPVPIGVTGELFIAGEGLARGYLRRPALTAEKFVPDPWAANPGGRLYRTGDLARHRPDGRLEFLGRRDHQIKLRGFRIEPAEIEAVLGRHPQVRTAVVVARDDDGDQQLVAYLLTRDGTEIETVALRDLVRRHLPDYMAPSFYVFLQALPLTPNGKLDRAALPVPRRGARSEHRAPRDRLELELTRIWEELLGLERADVRDDFFALGGHSLLALRLMAAIRGRLGHDLPLEALFRAPTIEGMAALLRRQGAQADPSLLVELRRGGPRPVLYCIHPAGGTVLCYHDLVRALAPDQPVYGLRARGLIAGEAPLDRIEEMAAIYLEAVREHHPPGPWFLLGWSLGGAVAYEMARRLVAEGQEVAVLAVIDTRARESEEPRFGSEAEMLARAVADEISIALDPIRHLDPAEQLAAVLREAQRESVLPPDFTVADARRYLNVYRAARAATWAYHPGPYAGRVVLFRATEEPEEDAADETLGWAQTVEGEIEIRRVPGTHHTMIRSPHVRTLAEQLQQLLDLSV